MISIIEDLLIDLCSENLTKEALRKPNNLEIVSVKASLTAIIGVLNLLALIVSKVAKEHYWGHRIQSISIRDAETSSAL